MGTFQERLEAVLARYFICCADEHPAEHKSLLDPLTVTLSHVAPALEGCAHAFKRNLKAVVDTTAIPFQLTSASVRGRRFQQLHIAARIGMLRRVKAGETLPEALEREAYEDAQKEMDRELQDKDKQEQLARATVEELHAALANPAVASAAAEILRQGEVLTWGALEVLSRDLFVAILNARPAFAGVVAQDEDCRRLFQMKALPLETLSTYAFDVSGHMGSILADQHPVDSVPSMKAVFRTLFPGNERLRELLSNRSLWLISQRRHLIVHRRAIVDDTYISNTGDAVAPGDELCISAATLEADLVLIRDIGLELILSGTALLREGDA
jgi:hypothetical protein